MPESTQARIAFVGAGNHSTESLYPNIAHIPEFDLVAVCDLVEERAESVARRFAAPEWFTDTAVMLDQVAPDGICVCGPPEMHHEVSLLALRRGIPCVTTLAGASAAVSAIEAARHPELRVYCLQDLHAGPPGPRGGPRVVG